MVIKGHSNGVSSVAFSPDGKFVLSGSADGTMKLWNAKTGELIYTNFSTPDGKYLTWTSEGFFSGNENIAREAVYILDGMDVIDISQFYDIFYRPDLIQAKVEGKDISKYAVDIETLIRTNGLPPVVEFVETPVKSDEREITLKMKIKDLGGGVGRITVFVDGAPVVIDKIDRGLRIINKTSNTNAGKEYNYEALITLKYGVNKIEFSAYNKSNTIESRKASLEIIHKEKEIIKPNLHILTIAVDKYRDKSLWLNYSKNDAEIVGKTFGDQSKKIFESINLYKLYDSDVTKEKVDAKFNEISKDIKPDDVFIFYLAGHGVTNDKDGDYYYLPSNFRYTGSEAISVSGISKHDIMGNLIKIKAQKSMILFDTCNSGSFIDKPASRGIAEKTAIDRLKKTIGRAIIVASSESQVALEGYENHGVFTYALIQGLLGKADFNKNSQVTVSEISMYIENEVPELTYKKWGYEQIPQKTLPKQDFPVVIIK
ncbi:MAG: hypothetical protein B7C24_14350 [Bacteroidetes bacterium 4572_77]|nr:MAG: hypothetical protein B7C24_14350 [Bacteroidetes bacterium 4572_77]